MSAAARERVARKEVVPCLVLLSAGWVLAGRRQLRQLRVLWTMRSCTSLRWQDTSMCLGRKLPRHGYLRDNPQAALSIGGHYGLAVRKMNMVEKRIRLRQRMLEDRSTELDDVGAAALKAEIAELRSRKDLLRRYPNTPSSELV
eukprot:TRINITY_DN1619_c0_g1_i5.p2 TRINITY_DN1619_c0_g1~~TRINITY_DN1619_c0_g1_i5.p2  ORF type:complete len:144 (-),score=15.43 TRINITY_DN1619_c0_g1_i5:32-463(-)